MNFNEEKYKIVPNAISKDVCEVVSKEFELLKDLVYLEDTKQTQYPNNDEMVEKSFSWYAPLAFESLSDTLVKRIVEDVVGEEVYPTFSYGRIYYNQAIMEEHKDRACSEYAVSLCLSVDQNVSWPLGIEDSKGNKIYVNQQPGDLIIYKGTELKHWRDMYLGTKQISAFFFYVRKNGPKSILKYDTRPMLGLPTSACKISVEQQWDMFHKDN